MSNGGEVVQRKVSAEVRYLQLFTRTCNSRNVARFFPIELSQNVEFYEVNSAPQTANKTLGSIRDLKFELLEYPYILWIVHRDFHMFGHLKDAVIGVDFYTKGVLKNAVY